MCKKRNVLVLLLLVVVAAVALELFAEQGTGESDFAIRKSEAQTVLYTVYRGPYEGIGKPIGELYALAAQKKIKICGPLSLVYLNNPYYTLQNDIGKHCLTEIRIPVGEEVLQEAETFGEMTDVKELKSIKIAVIQKNIGQMDYRAIFKSLYEQIARQGYRPADTATEVFLSNMASGDYDYTRIKSEIIVPVARIGSE